MKQYDSVSVEQFYLYIYGRLVWEQAEIIRQLYENLNNVARNAVQQREMHETLDQHGVSLRPDESNSMNLK